MLTTTQSIQSRRPTFRRPIYSTRGDHRVRTIEILVFPMEPFARQIFRGEIDEARRRIEKKRGRWGIYYVYHPSDAYKKFITRHFKKTLR